MNRTRRIQKVTQCVTAEGGAWTRTDNFEAACADFTASLEAKKYSRAYCGPIKERQVRNLDALLAIEGNLITEVVITFLVRIFQPRYVPHHF